MHNPDIQIIETIAAHIREMAVSMKSDAAETALKLGMTPGQALWRSFKQSLYSKSAFIDGKLAAIWGIGGQLFSDTGLPWLIMTPDAEDYPFRVAFIFRKELKKMQELYPVLEDYVGENNDKAARMLALMGFEISKNKIPLGDMVMHRAERKMQ